MYKYYLGINRLELAFPKEKLLSEWLCQLLPQSFERCVIETH